MIHFTGNQSLGKVSEFAAVIDLQSPVFTKVTKQEMEENKVCQGNKQTNKCHLVSNSISNILNYPLVPATK